MSLSPLRGFNRRSVDQLLEAGVHMVYDFNMIRSENWGYWMLDYRLIGINPNIVVTAGKKTEDHVIVHECLHACENLILGVRKRFRESQIDYWAHHHLGRDRFIAEYIRDGYEYFGFKHNYQGNTFKGAHFLKGVCLTPAKNFSSNKTPAKNI